MSLQTLTYIVVGLSFALYIGIAFWSRAHSTGDFYIAGRGVSPLANGMAHFTATDVRPDGRQAATAVEIPWEAARPRHQP